MLRNDTKPRRIFSRQTMPLHRRVLLMAALTAPYLLRAKPAAADRHTVRMRAWKLVHSREPTVPQDTA